MSNRKFNMVKNEEARSWEYAEIQLSYEARYCGHWWSVQQQLDLFNYWLKEQHPELKPRTLTQFKGKLKKDKWKEECDKFYRSRLVSGEDSLSYACRKLESWFKAHKGAKEQYIKEHREFYEKAKKKAETKPPVKMLEGLSADKILSSKRESCMKVPKVSATTTSSTTSKLVDPASLPSTTVGKCKDTSSKERLTKEDESTKKASSEFNTILPEEYLMAHFVTVAWPNVEEQMQNKIFEAQMSNVAGVRYESTVEQFRQAIAEYARQEELKIDAAVKKVLAKVPPAERIKQQILAKKAAELEKADGASSNEENFSSESHDDSDKASESSRSKKSDGSIDDSENISDDDAPLALVKSGLKRKAKALKGRKAEESADNSKQARSVDSSEDPEGNQQQQN